MTTTSPLNVLFLCTHNSARSILAEALLNDMGQDRFKAYSAGSSPRENQQPNPLGLQVLQKAGIATEGLRSKSWDEFAAADAPQMDFIITVCDNAAGETCPLWPGQPISAHWGFPDPAAVQGSEAEQRAAFEQVFQRITQRVRLLLDLPLASLDALAIRRELQNIGRQDGAGAV